MGVLDTVLLASDGDLSDILLLEVRRQTCELLGNTFGYLIQFTLGFFALSSLIWKRWLEVPPRGWLEFFYDTSKQAVGSLMSHVLNMLFAHLLVGDRFQNACLWYLVNFVVDSVLGLILNWIVLRIVESVAAHCGWTILESGRYHNGSKATFFLQLFVWNVIVVVNKLVLLFGFIVPLKHPLYAAGAYLMRPVDPYPKLELLLVMIVIPLVFNVFVFWLTDSFIKARPLVLADEQLRVPPEDKLAAKKLDPEPLPPKHPQWRYSHRPAGTTSHRLSSGA